MGGREIQEEEESGVERALVVLTTRPIAQGVPAMSTNPGIP